MAPDPHPFDAVSVPEVGVAVGLGVVAVEPLTSCSVGAAVPTVDDRSFEGAPEEAPSDELAAVTVPDEVGSVDVVPEAVGSDDALLEVVAPEEVESVDAESEDVAPDELVSDDVVDPLVSEPDGDVMNDMLPVSRLPAGSAGLEEVAAAPSEAKSPEEPAVADGSLPAVTVKSCDPSLDNSHGAPEAGVPPLRLAPITYRLRSVVSMASSVPG
jgi:hypothetical protein